MYRAARFLPLVILLLLFPGVGKVYGQSIPAGTWQGAATNNTVAFGGGAYCSYTATMQNVTLSFTLNSSGVVTAAAASATMVEQAPGCPYPVIPQNVHQFTGTGNVQSGTLTINFAGASSNAPQDKGTFTGTLSGGRVIGTLTFTRTDQVAPFVWTTTHSADLAPALQVDQTNVSLTATAGNSASTTVNVTASAGTLKFTITPSSSGWLSTSPDTHFVLATTPQAVTITANAAGLSVGSVLTGTVYLACDSTTPCLGVFIYVTFTVTGALNTITTSVTSVPFSTDVQNVTFTSAIVKVTSSPNPVALTATVAGASPWLQTTFSNSSNTPTNLELDVTAPATAGYYLDAVVVACTGGFNCQGTASVAVALTNAVFLKATRSHQTVTTSVIVSGAGSGAISIKYSTQSGGSWLSGPSSGTAGTPFTVSANSGLMAPANYTGTITVTGSGYSVAIPVTFQLQGNQVTLSTTTLNFNVAAGASAATQQFTVSNPQGFVVTLTPADSFLVLTPGSGNVTIPKAITVGVNAASLHPGDHPISSIAVQCVTDTCFDTAVAVQVTVPGAPALQVSSSALNFTVPAASVSGSQSIGLTVASGSAAWTATAPTWVALSPAGGTATVSSSAISVSVDSHSLPAGASTGTVTFSCANATICTPVSLQINATVTAPVNGLVPSMSALTLSGDGIVTSGQTSLSVTSSGAALPVTVNVSGCSWLTATADNVVTPLNVNLAANPAGLTPKTYQCTLVLTAASSGTNPLSLPVTFNLLAGTATSAVIPHIADSGSWTTTISLVNLDSTPASWTLTFYSDTGGPLSLAWAGQTGSVSTLTGTIPAGGSQTLKSAGAGASVLQGWALLQSANRVGGTAIFASGGQEAAVPILRTTQKTQFFPFDNGAGLATGVALAAPKGPSSTEASTWLMKRQDGTVLTTSQLLIQPANGHTSFLLPVPSTQQQDLRGAAEFDASNDPVFGLGIRSRALLTKFAFTSVEALYNQTPATGIVSHIANGQTWKTTLILVNTDSVPASYTVNFWQDNGNPFSLPLVGGTQTSSQSGTIPVGGAVTIESDGLAQQLSEGWAEVISSQSVTGTAIFQWQQNGQEAAVPLISSAAGKLVFPFDSSNNLSLGIALANTSFNADSSFTLTVRDGAGNQLGAPIAMQLPRHQHTAFLPAIPANVQGTVEIDSPGVPIYGLGIRFNAGAFTSIRALPK